MASAKDIELKFIAAVDANRLCKLWHYSGKTVPNSQMHIGVFIGGRCGGVMQFGPCMDKRRMLGLVNGANWNDFLELNRMAFSDILPRNSESRALAVSFRLIKKNYPHIKWIVSFSDATQCGDGTIYRASGFVLTSIKKNTTILKLADGRILADKTLNNDPYFNASYYKRLGARPIDGYQLRYIKFLDESVRKNLSVQEIPFSKIAELGISMYKGKKCVPSKENVATVDQTVEDGANPIGTLHA